MTLSLSKAQFRFNRIARIKFPVACHDIEFYSQKGASPLAEGVFIRLRKLLLVGGGLLFGAACTPTVQVAVPSEPITINLNIKIEHEIKIKVEKELDELFDEDSGLF